MQLFVYGVLREGLGDWPFLAGIGPGRAATTSGDLFAISDPQGWCPALRHGQGPGWGTVTGTLHDVESAVAAGAASLGKRLQRGEVIGRPSGALLAALLEPGVFAAKVR